MQLPLISRGVHTLFDQRTFTQKSSEISNNLDAEGEQQKTEDLFAKMLKLVYNFH